jgi:hypothetical protein
MHYRENHEEVNEKWLRKGKEREMKKDIGKEMNKVQNIAKSSVYCHRYSCLMVEVKE